MRKDPKGFEDYRRNSWWYAGKLTKSNFDQVAAFIKRCTAGTFEVNKEAYTITYSNHWRVEPVTAQLGMIIARNVSGGDYGEVLAISPREFKQRYHRNFNYGNLKYYRLTDVEYGVLQSIVENDSDCYYPYSWIMDYTHVDKKETKKAVDHLRELGLLNYLNGLMNEDGEVAGSGFGIDTNVQHLMIELLMTRYEQSRNREWWVTRHDGPKNAAIMKIAGPFTTSEDAGVARQQLEKAESHHNYWIEKITEGGE